MTTPIKNLEFYITPWETGNYDINILENDRLWYTWVPEYQAFVFDFAYCYDSMFDHDYTHDLITKEQAVELIESKAKHWPVRYLNLYTDVVNRISYNDVLDYLKKSA